MGLLSMFSGGGGGAAIALEPVTNLVAVPSNAQVSLTWTDPTDKTAEPTGESVATWGYTRIIRKVGSAPSGPNDGVLVVESGVRDQYKSTPYVDTGLANGSTYFYSAYAYTNRGIVSKGVNTEGVTPKAYDFVLASNSWDIIKQAGEIGDAENVWSIGDTKPVHLQGRLSGTGGGFLDLNVDLNAFILSFHHNESVEGKGIHFGLGKSSTSQYLVMLVSKNYGSRITSGLFIMRTSDNTAGGWASSVMKTVIIPRLTQLMPQELTNTWRTITKYSDNTGISNPMLPDWERKASPTQETLFLLSGKEFMGDQHYSVTDHCIADELLHQEQYEYFKLGNSGFFETHDGSQSGKLMAAWTRSCAKKEADCWCAALGNTLSTPESDTDYGAFFAFVV